MYHLAIKRTAASAPGQRIAAPHGDHRMGLRELLQLWAERARSRRQLARLDTRLLNDIGIDAATARREAAKPFWQA